MESCWMVRKSLRTTCLPLFKPQYRRCAFYSCSIQGICHVGSALAEQSHVLKLTYLFSWWFPFSSTPQCPNPSSPGWGPVGPEDKIHCSRITKWLKVLHSTDNIQAMFNGGQLEVQARISHIGRRTMDWEMWSIQYVNSSFLFPCVFHFLKEENLPWLKANHSFEKPQLQTDDNWNGKLVQTELFHIIFQQARFVLSSHSPLFTFACGVAVSRALAFFSFNHNYNYPSNNPPKWQHNVHCHENTSRHYDNNLRSSNIRPIQKTWFVFRCM